MKLEYYRQLDGVRGVAALMVIFFHFFALNPSAGGILHAVDKIAVFGGTGVSLFFVLSGFLITRILLATKQDPHYFTDFYIRRSLRIFPLYYFFLALFYFIIPSIQHAPIVPWNGQFCFWVYLQNYAMIFHWSQIGPGHLWTLAVEEHFYLLWPCIIYFFDKKGIRTAIAIILVIALVCRLLPPKGYEAFFFTISRMGVLVSGALLAVWESEGKLKKYARIFLPGLIILLITLLFLWIAVPGKAPADIRIIKFDLLPAGCYFFFIGFVITRRQSNTIDRLLTSRMLTFTGKISYGLYIYHPLCFDLLLSIAPSTSILERLLLSVGSCYLVATASYYLFETRFTALKKYFAYDRSLDKNQSPKAGNSK